MKEARHEGHRYMSPIMWSKQTQGDSEKAADFSGQVGSKGKEAWGFSVTHWKGSESRAWWYLYTSVNIIKKTLKYILQNGQLYGVWLLPQPKRVTKNWQALVGKANGRKDQLNRLLLRVTPFLLLAFYRGSISDNCFMSSAELSIILYRGFC